MRQSLRINQYIFQSTLSVRRATRAEFSRSIRTVFQSTLSVRRATLDDLEKQVGQYISIHALREESDLLVCGFGEI